MKASFNGVLVYSQERVCPLCGKRFSPNLHETEEHWRPTVDHVLPKSRGGYRGRGNCLAAHKRCNEKKGDRLPTGCEVIWLIAVCERNRWPVRLKEGSDWWPPKLNALGSGAMPASNPTVPTLPQSA